MRLRTFPLLLFVCFSLALSGLPSKTHAQLFAFESWSIGDGLPQSQVWDLLEDSRGYIWMGTRGGGLCRFDGATFQSFSNREGLPNNFVASLMEDSDGLLWIGTDEGLCSYNGVTFSTIQIPDTLSPLKVNALLQDHDGIIWAGTSNGLFQIKEKKAIKHTTGQVAIDKTVSCLFEDSKNQLWVGTTKGIHLLAKDGNITSYGTNQGMVSRRIGSIAEDKNGLLWIATTDKGINTFDGTTFQQFDASHGLKDGIIHSVYADAEQRIWISTLNNGAAYFSQRFNTFMYLNESNGLCNNHVRSVLHDSWGNFWFGTSGGGVSKYYQERFRHYGTNEGLPGNYVYSVFFDSKERMWVGTNGLGVSLARNDSFFNFDGSNGFLDAKVRTIEEDHLGRIWLGTDAKGLGVYDGEKFQIINGENGLGDTWISDILLASDSSIWVATSGYGVSIITFSDSSLTTPNIVFQTKDDGLPDNRVTCLHQDQKGRVWAGTSKGLSLFENGNWRTFTTADGLAHNSIRQLEEDAFGTLWIASRGNQLNRLSLYGDATDFNFAALSHKDGLTSTNVYGILAHKSTVWLGSEAGLDRLSLEANGQLKNVRHFGQAEGMKGIELANGAIALDRKERLWLGTIESLELFDPAQNTTNKQQPQLSLSNISLFYQPLATTDYGAALGPWHEVEDPIRLEHTDNHLTFDFAAVDQRNPEKVRYQWRLDPAEKEWSPANVQHSAIYSNIQPGNYTFMVRAYNEDAVSSEVMQFPFQIKEPFWKSWWFIVLCIGVGVLFIGGLFYRRLRQVKARAKQAQEKLQLEKDIVQLEQKALRLQMNPHFIFNALNSIQGLIVQKDAKTARYFLSKFSKLMRLILENSRSTRIPLHDEISTLDNYLALEQFSAGEHFEYTIAVAEDIDPEEVDIPPMLIQPFVENAVIHGLKGISEGKGRIEVRFVRDEYVLRCEIVDNGIGRKAAALHKAQKVSQHKSAALAVTQERLAIINAQLHSTGPSLVIEDLLDSSGNALGTKVSLCVPVLQ